MTTYEKHKELLLQSFRKLRLCVIEGLENNSRDVAFHVSAGSVDMLSMLLHKTNKIEAGFVIKHEWFKKPQEEQKKISLYEQRISADFPHKEPIYNLMCEIESLRNKVAYSVVGKDSVQKMLDDFFKLKETIENLLGEKFE